MSMGYMLSAIEVNHDDDVRYSITFYEDTIDTLVTKSPSSVDTWIDDIEYEHRHHLHNLIVGLDCEWHPNRIPNQENPIATIQLCVGHRCLIFQILRSPFIPWSLGNFLRNPSYTFTGAGIGNDAEKLLDHWNLEVANTADIRSLAAEEYGMRELRNAGLKRLTLMVLRKEMNKPWAVTMSNWDNEWLTRAQVEYACIDAFVSYKIGRFLIQRALN